MGLQSSQIHSGMKDEIIAVYLHFSEEGREHTHELFFRHGGPAEKGEMGVNLIEDGGPAGPCLEDGIPIGEDALAGEVIQGHIEAIGQGGED